MKHPAHRGLDGRQFLTRLGIAPLSALTMVN
jgi:hypothetical protein